MRGRALVMLPVTLAALIFVIVLGFRLRRTVAVVPAAAVRTFAAPRLPAWTRLATAILSTSRT